MMYNIYYQRQWKVSWNLTVLYSYSTESLLNLILLWNFRTAKGQYSRIVILWFKYPLNSKTLGWLLHHFFDTASISLSIRSRETPWAPGFLVHSLPQLVLALLLRLPTFKVIHLQYFFYILHFFCLFYPSLFGIPSAPFFFQVLIWNWHR